MGKATSFNPTGMSPAEIAAAVHEADAKEAVQAERDRRRAVDEAAEFERYMAPLTTFKAKEAYREFSETVERTEATLAAARERNPHSYQVVTEEVDEAILEQLWATSFECAAELGLEKSPFPQVLRQTDDWDEADLHESEAIVGLCRRGEKMGEHPVVYVVERDLHGMLRTLAHEVEHVRQDFRGNWNSPDAEEKAERFSAAMIGEDPRVAYEAAYERFKQRLAPIPAYGGGGWAGGYTPRRTRWLVPV